MVFTFPRIQEILRMLPLGTDQMFSGRLPPEYGSHFGPSFRRAAAAYHEAAELLGNARFPPQNA